MKPSWVSPQPRQHQNQSFPMHYILLTSFCNRSMSPCFPKCLKRYQSSDPKRSNTSGAQWECPMFSYFVKNLGQHRLKLLWHREVTCLTAPALPNPPCPHQSWGKMQCSSEAHWELQCEFCSKNCFSMDLLGKKSLFSASITFFKKFVTAWKTRCTCRSGGLACRKQVFPSSPALPSAVSRHMSLCTERQSERERKCICNQLSLHQKEKSCKCLRKEMNVKYCSLSCIQENLIIRDGLEAVPLGDKGQIHLSSEEGDWILPLWPWWFWSGSRNPAR